MVNLLGREIEFREKYTYQIGSDGISEEGVYAIKRYLLNLESIYKWADATKSIDRVDIINGTWSKKLVFPEDWQWTWIVKGKGEYVGTLTKRISKYIYKKMGISLTQDELQALGCLASDNSMNNHAYIFDFTDVFDWTSSEFGESSSSCWWERGADSYKDRFQNIGGLAMRFYNEAGRGRARCWLSLEDEHLVIFNGYGMESGGGPTLPIARVLASWLGMSYKRIEVTCCDLYINSSVGYAIGSTEALESVNSKNYEVDRLESWGTCENCGDDIEDENSANYYNGDCYCQDCFDHLFFSCYHCGNNHPIGDSVIVEGDYWCENCVSNHAVSCAVCNELVSDRHSYFISGDELDVCPDCYSHNVAACETCHYDFLIDNLNEGLCEACHEQKQTKEAETELEESQEQ